MSGGSAEVGGKDPDIVRWLSTACKGNGIMSAGRMLTLLLLTHGRTQGERHKLKSTACDNERQVHRENHRVTGRGIEREDKKNM